MNGSAQEPEVQERPEHRTLYAGVRGAAVRILNRVERSDSYLDRVLDAELRGTELSDLDKGLLTEIVHGVLRWQNKLDWVLNGFSHGNFQKSEVNIKNTLRVALYQILFLDRIPHAAAVNEAVELIKRIRGDKVGGLVNAVLRNIIRNLEGIRYPDPNEDKVQYLSVMYSHPHWMVKRWVKRLGDDETQKLLVANNERPGLSLRINKLKAQPGEFLTMLDQQHIQYSGSTHIDFFVKVKSLTRIGQMDLFRRGFFTIQDESAILPCLMLAPQPGERVIDLCAAPGGKTTAMAEMMKNEGEIIAVDKYEIKLSFIKAACDRLGLRNVKLLAVDASTLESDQADKVLLDVPCSGLGVLTKKPDIKWKRDITDIIKLAKMQGDFIANAARLVKPGGVLVYSTCTTEPEENQEIVKQFLMKHPEFTVEDARQYVSHDLVNGDGFVETYPHRDGMDGSFAVRFRKAS
ncbi:MAG: Ribosomal small subunit methyltransferase [Bacteroidetes bacterium]|nr:Ribosomal small subunit methyltransferase [Bacteroidota bacterium]